MTLHIFDTLPSSFARLSKFTLCLIIGLLVWIMRVTFCVLYKDSTPISKLVILNFSS